MPVILTLSVAEGEEPRIWPLLLLLPGLSSNTPTRIRSNHPSPQNVRTKRPAAPKPKGPPRNLPGGPSDNYMKTQNSKLTTSTCNDPPCKVLPPERSGKQPASRRASSASRRSSRDAAVQPLRPASSAECRCPPCTCPCSPTGRAAPASGLQSCSTSQSSGGPSRSPGSPAGPRPVRRCYCRPRMCTC